MEKRKRDHDPNHDNIDTFEKSLENLRKTLSEKYPMGVRRCDLEKATGGVLYGPTESNKDSLGEGMPGSFRVARHMVYPIDSIVSTIRKRHIPA